MHLLRRPALVAGALTCAVALAGCASSASTSQPGTSGSTPAASPSAPAASASSSDTPAVAAPSASAGGTACATSALQIKLGASDGYAGGVYQTIDFTNTSGSTCTLFGYPGVSLVTGPPYQQLGVPAKRSTTTPAKVVTLAPGATANAVLQIVDALNFPSPSCQPTKAAALKVYPPNQFTAVYLPDTSYGCGNPVQTMYIAPVRPGANPTH
ncbi:MAG TPA: DUF4232 domain-containing protein [Streptosporangiaceae bacterium]|nr:DUF4232 domain-containing protein [Streptosporangiaceae bacterium]